jgi:hypothetical protein
MTDAERIAELEAEVARLRDLVVTLMQQSAPAQMPIPIMPDEQRLTLGPIVVRSGNFGGVFETNPDPAVIAPLMTPAHAARAPNDFLIRGFGDRVIGEAHPVTLLTLDVDR